MKGQESQKHPNDFETQNYLHQPTNPDETYLTWGSSMQKEDEAG